MSEIITNTCPRGGFFDGNENFGGPPYRGFMALLCFAPTMFLFLSAAWWFICYRKQRAETVAPIIQNSNITSPQNSNYQTMNDNTSALTNVDLTVDDHPIIDDSLYYVSEPSSPITSSSVGPQSSPSPDNNRIMIPAPSSSPLSASLLTTQSPEPSSSSSFSIDNNNNNNSVAEIRNSAISKHTRFLLFCRSLIRPKALFRSSLVFSCIQFIITLLTLIYAIVAGEQCCYGGTGAMYAILCLRLSLSYTNIRVGFWQTNSRTNTISVVDKSCQIGYLIHFVWLAFAFVLVSDDGQCQIGAPVMYNVSLVSIIILLINYTIFAIFTGLSYIYINHAKSDVMIVLSRTFIKFCLIGWAYGKELDLNDAITDIEMEIACLPCVTYDEMIVREKNKKARRQMYDMEKNGTQLSVKIDNMNEASKKEDTEIEALSCAICLSAYESSDMIRPLPCGHHLHKSCSDSWLKVKSTCPLCVRSVLVQ
jgi:hypothetical protein